MTHRTRIEIADGLKILTLAAAMFAFGIILRKDVDAQSAQVARIETKVDGLLVANARMAVYEERLDDFSKRLDRTEKH